MKVPDAPKIELNGTLPAVVEPTSPFINKNLSGNFKTSFTKTELGVLFGKDPRTLNQFLAGKSPINPSASPKMLQWQLSDVATLFVDYADEESMSPKDRLDLVRIQSTKEDVVTKRMKNAVTRNMLIPAPEVEQGLAEAFKVFSLWIEQLPDYLERKGAIPVDKVNALVVSLNKMREQLYESLLMINVVGEVDDTDYQHEEYEVDDSGKG